VEQICSENALSFFSEKLSVLVLQIQFLNSDPVILNLKLQLAKNLNLYLQKEERKK
jgi:hypothetical protein